MTTDATLVVGYKQGGRAAAELAIRKLVRTQGVLLLILGVVLGLVVLVPFVAMAIDVGGLDAVGILVAIALLVVPAALVAFGVRQLRRRPRLPEVAVTVTPTAVLFPQMDRPSALAPLVRAEEWPREGTNAEIIPAAGLRPARIEFARQDATKRRRRSINADALDVDARTIVDALSLDAPGVDAPSVDA